MSDSLSAPLEGIRVLDLTRVLAGPYCTMILADLGAEVVKIERPETGDDARHFGPFLPSGLSVYFAGVNRGKKSMVLDLKDEEDRETFLQLVDQADVLVENFQPGAMEAFGLSAQALRERNPRLIYTALSGFGHEGLETSRPAYDIVIQAMSGLMSITGEGLDSPMRVGTSISDILTGMFGAVSVLSSLRQRDKDGAGAMIDMAMLDCTVAVLENAINRFSITGESPVPLGTRHPAITPFQAFETADEPIVVAAGNDRLWKKLCEVLDCSELADDERFATNNARTENRDHLDSELGPRLMADTQANWLARLDAAGVPAAPIRNIEQVVNDPHLASRDMWHDMHDSQGATLRTAASPFRTDGHKPRLSDHAPELGEHTQSVLEEWLGEDRQARGD